MNVFPSSQLMKNNTNNWCPRKIASYPLLKMEYIHSFGKCPSFWVKVGLLPVLVACHHFWQGILVLQPKLWPWEEWLSSFFSFSQIFSYHPNDLHPSHHFTISHTTDVRGPIPAPFAARPRVMYARDSHHSSHIFWPAKRATKHRGDGDGFCSLWCQLETMSLQ